jgi:hypothetical protein
MGRQPTLQLLLPPDGSLKRYAKHAANGGILNQFGVLLNQLVGLSQTFSLHGNLPIWQPGSWPANPYSASLAVFPD